MHAYCIICISYASMIIYEYLWCMIHVAFPTRSNPNALGHFAASLASPRSRLFCTPLSGTRLRTSDVCVPSARVMINPESQQGQGKNEICEARWTMANHGEPLVKHEDIKVQTNGISSLNAVASKGYCTPYLGFSAVFCGFRCTFTCIDVCNKR